MTDDLYKRTLKAAITDANRLQSEIAEKQKELIATKQVIVSMRAKLGHKALMEQSVGLKEACIEALRSENNPISLGRVAQTLKGIGFDLSGYSSPLSSIRNTLTRMIGKEIEVTVVKRKKLYKIKPDDWLNF